jgi:iron complex transport system substrate-binding protein
MKKFLTIVLGLILMLNVTACSNKQNNSSQANTSASDVTITDDAGEKVTIKGKVTKIADAWRAHNEVVVVLGGGKEIVATVNKKSSVPWLYKVVPDLNNAISTFGDDFNTEDLVSRKPDVVFMSDGDKNAAKISSLGIPVVQLSFTNFSEMKHCISLTAEVMGKDAVERAEKYNNYLDSTVNSIKEKTSSLTDDKRPKVLHVESLNPIEVDGGSTIINEWIETAGGINVAKGVKGNMKEVSMEHILKWNPDVIIIGANGVNGKVTTVDELKSNELWANVSAVKNNKVYQNPTGAYLWDRYSPEEVLQLQWAAKTLHPDLFQDIDIKEITYNYYKDYLGYSLTDSDIERILNAQPPEN